MLIGWTTVETRAQAETLSRGLISLNHAVCVQIEGPITSVYRWQGEVAESTEYRLMVKFLRPQATEAEAWLLNHHPYDTPEWIVASSDHVAEKYLSWAEANANSLPL